MAFTVRMDRTAEDGSVHRITLTNVKDHADFQKRLTTAAYALFMDEMDRKTAELIEKARALRILSDETARR